MTAATLGHPERDGHGGRGRGSHRGGRRRATVGQPRGGLAARLAACAACCVLAAIAVKENYQLRGVEAGLAGHVIALITGRPAGSIPGTTTFWFSVTAHRHMGLQITEACTVVLMTTPFLIATALLVWRKSSAVRPLLACAVATIMLLIVNQLRIVTIIMFIVHMGYGGGFYWGHTLIGSLITILGGSVTLIVYVLIVVRRGIPGRTRRSAR